MNLAPVLDVNNNPDNPVIGLRSFGSSPEQVGQLGLAMIEAYKANGIIATAKHFPGHGDTAIDSHLIWKESNWPPFKLQVTGM
jgi:beta-N-acetylhexosaminidase